MYPSGFNVQFKDLEMAYSDRHIYQNDTLPNTMTKKKQNKTVTTHTRVPWKNMKLYACSMQLSFAKCTSRIYSRICGITCCRPSKSRNLYVTI